MLEKGLRYEREKERDIRYERGREREGEGGSLRGGKKERESRRNSERGLSLGERRRERDSERL
jgi:hypothetical protein